METRQVLTHLSTRQKDGEYVLPRLDATHFKSQKTRKFQTRETRVCNLSTVPSLLLFYERRRVDYLVRRPQIFLHFFPLTFFGHVSQSHRLLFDITLGYDNEIARRESLCESPDFNGTDQPSL